VASIDDLAVFAALQGRFQAIQAQTALLALFTVATETRGLKDGANVFGVGDAFLLGRRRQFTEVHVGRQGRAGGANSQTGDNT